MLSEGCALLRAVLQCELSLPEAPLRQTTQPKMRSVKASEGRSLRPAECDLKVTAIVIAIASLDAFRLWFRGLRAVKRLLQARENGSTQSGLCIIVQVAGLQVITLD